MTTHQLKPSIRVTERGDLSDTSSNIVYTPQTSSPERSTQLELQRATLSPSSPSTPSTSPKFTHSHNLEPGVTSSFTEERRSEEEDLYGEEDDDNDDEMETRPPLHRPTDGRSQQPLLKDEGRGRTQYESPHGSTRPAFAARRSTFRSRSPDLEGSAATKKRYAVAAVFLLISLVAFVVQTETAGYIQNTLGWKKAYCMLWLTHGSWCMLWPMQLLILRIQKWRLPWRAFWRRHVYLVRSTAQMVMSGDQHLMSKESHQSPIPYILKKTAFVTTALTIAGGSWYLAIGWTTESDLTAIYNCSTFFAYAFSVPLLGDKLRLDKVISVIVAFAGVLVIAYGDSSSEDGQDSNEATNRLAGNIVIGVGSVLYGLYEVLYKKLACPPDGVSPGRGVIFANTFGSCIGLFTLFVLWIPLPILHVTGIEKFEIPTGGASYLLAISTLSNAVFSGCFLVLISLTSPVLSSVAALLTIFLVAITEVIRTNKKLSGAAIGGGIMIIVAFFVLSWSTYREMDEERRKKLEEEIDDSEEEEMD